MQIVPPMVRLARHASALSLAPPSLPSSLLLRGGTTSALPSSSLGAAPSAALAAAVAAPLASTFGIHALESWSGSAVVLNGFKCTVAASLFGLTLLLRRGSGPLLSLGPPAARMLMLSSLVGLVAGDLLWLRALRILGAHDTIVLSALHPVVAWAAGSLFLDQSCSPRTLAGAFLVAAGVTATQLGDRGSSPATARTADRTLGYLLNLGNLVLDVAGCVLTRKYGAGCDTFELCFVRAGTAAAALLFLAAGGRAAAKVRGRAEPAWTRVPEQSRESWAAATAGGFLLTYLNPALGNYAIFALPLAAWTALGGLGPVYSLPIKWVKEKKCLSKRGMIGVVFAVGGSALLGMEAYK